MLAALHDKIIKVIPIHGVSKDGDGNVSVSYIDQPNDSQLQEINQIINSWPLEEAKLKKLAKIDAEWSQTIAQGWNSEQGTLGLTANDIALLSGCHALGKEADALGMPIPSIVTMENTEITFTTMAQFTQLMLQYGAYRAHLSSTFAARRRAVESATTLEELENI
jgi:hypothetical protein